MNNEEMLSDGVNTVVRIGNTVRRIPGIWTKSTHALLHQLRNRGFFAAPQVFGFDETGREVLSYIGGKVNNYPLNQAARSEEALISAAKLLRAYHDATVDFATSYRGVWQFTPHTPVEVICHGDYAPYNCVIKDNKVIGIIDFDTAHPGPRLWDIAYAVYRFAPLTSPDNPDGFGLREEQAERMNIFCESYGLEDKKQLIPTVMQRIMTLVSFMQERAQAGEKAYQKFIATGHLQLYLQDFNYIKDNKTFFMNAIVN
jgi:Ser/Thr protein kinase RdoA (MazF antagonist)